MRQSNHQFSRLAIAAPRAKLLKMRHGSFAFVAFGMIHRLWESDVLRSSDFDGLSVSHLKQDVTVYHSLTASVVLESA